MRHLLTGLLIGLLLWVSGPARPDQAAPSLAEIPATAEYLLVDQGPPTPELVFAFPSPFPPGLAGSRLPAAVVSHTLTLYLPASSAPGQSPLGATVRYRRGARLTVELAFPPPLYFGLPGTTLPATYDPAAHTLSVPLP